MSPVTKTEPKSIVGKVIFITFVVLVIAALVCLVIFQQQKLNSPLSTNSAATAKIQAQVAKLMLLPEEEAIITPIDNADDIKNQPFFSQVANGDQVLIFAQAAKIVIYRPSQNVIVNVGPIIDDRASAATPTDSSAVDPSSLAAPVNSDASSTADVN